MKNFREIEQLSAYLDGQLNASETVRVESRIKSDPELASVLNDLRTTRSLLRKLPARKAPRNFTLTRKMVGLKPPLPRTYPLFRLATAFATVLFLLSFSVNALSPYFSFGGAAAPVFGYGGGGGGDATAMEAPAATEEMSVQEMPPAEEAATEAAVPEATEEARVTEPTPEAFAVPKDVQPEPTAQAQPQELQPQPEVQGEAPVPAAWMIAFLVIGILSALAMWLMRQSAVNKWR